MACGFQMESHQDSVAKLRDSLGGSGEAGGYDDVWLLRFVLSHKDDLEAARKAAANAIAWREKNAKLLQVRLVSLTLTMVGCTANCGCRQSARVWVRAARRLRRMELGVFRLADRSFISGSVAVSQSGTFRRTTLG